MSSGTGGEPSVPCEFCGYNHGWCPSIPALNEPSSSRVSHIFSLNISVRDSTRLLEEAKLAGGNDQLLLLYCPPLLFLFFKYLTTFFSLQECLSHR